jgi:MarR family transcriptional regulator, organic hydroperoxide resistance regulator
MARGGAAGSGVLDARLASHEISTLYAEIYRYCHPAYASPISHQAVRALQRISVGALTVNELAERLRCAPNTASEIVKRLTARSLVTKVRRKDDERVVDLAITGSGRAALEEHTGLDVERLRAGLEGLSEKEVRRIRDGLGTLLTAVRMDAKPC